MEKLLLDGKWELHYAPEHAGKTTAQAVKEDPAYTHIEANVPGNAELDLYAAGKAPEPFWGTNLYAFRPYEFYEWWYTRTFVAPQALADRGAVLCLDGVDTFSTVYLNGTAVGETDDMMLEYRFDVTEALREGENEIAVHIRSTVNAARNMDYPMGVRGPGWEHTDEMICVRKPGHMFGWDIAPRFVSAGLWRSVSICPKRDTYFKEVYMTTLRADRERAQVLLKFRFAAEDPMLDGFAVQVRGTCAESSFCETVRVKFCSDELSFWVPEPKLWWPRGTARPAFTARRWSCCTTERCRTCGN